MTPFTDEDSRQFIEEGYIVLREAFSRELAERLIPMVWSQLKLDPEDTSTWPGPMVMLRKVFEEEPFPQVYTPRYYSAVDFLCGAGRWRASKGVGHWPISLPGFAKPPWSPPEGGWHLDGNLDRWRVDCPGRALIGLELFTDIDPGDGGTAIRVASHRRAARILAEAESDGLAMEDLISRLEAETQHLCVVEVNGRAGDVILMHPLTLHAGSPNINSRVRILANKPFNLRAPLQLGREDSLRRSPVERAIVDSLADAPK